MRKGNKCKLKLKQTNKKTPESFTIESFFFERFDLITATAATNTFSKYVCIAVMTPHLSGNNDLMLKYRFADIVQCQQNFRLDIVQWRTI